MPKIEHETKKAEAIRWMNILGIDRMSFRSSKTKVLSQPALVSQEVLFLSMIPNCWKKSIVLSRNGTILFISSFAHLLPMGSWTLFFSQTTILTNGSFQEKNLKTVTL